jgi:UDP-GlcNAc3NAcA epimerase
MSKIITILGARPQFIKAATISREINNRINSNRNIEEIIVHTGQHYDTNMSDIFFEQMNIPKPKYSLNISGLSHGAMTGRMIEGIENILLLEKPDLVLVYGDTNSTLAGTIAASKIDIPIAHVESGLRSFNFNMPEEVNRIVTDRLASILFCPTNSALINLTNEGYPNQTYNGRKQLIVNVGDVMYDSVLFYKKYVRENIDIKVWSLQDKKYVLCTFHRNENLINSHRLYSIFSALRKISETIDVVIPLHPNTKKIINNNFGMSIFKNLKIIDPLPFFEMQRLEMSAKLIITDSGGIQKEAYFHDVPCITVREETEWSETVITGWNKLVGYKFNDIIKAFDEPFQNLNSPNKNIFGDGNSAKKIVDILADYI